MTTRIVMVDHISPLYSDQGDMCTGCKRLMTKAQLVSCQHFGPLARKPGTKNTYLRHANCIRAEERTKHASHSAAMMKGDFDDD